MSESCNIPAIQSPELLTARQRRRETALTGLMWMLYVYLWTPLLSMLAWLVGFDFAYEVMVRAGGMQALKQVVWWYAAAIFSILLITAAWSVSNRLRFRNRNRRQIVARLEDQALMDWFGVNQEQLTLMRAQARVEIEFDAQGVIGSISGATSPAPQTSRRRQPG